MKERIWTAQEIVNMSRNEWLTFQICVRARAWGMLGIAWKKRIEWEWDKFNGSLIVRYE